MVRDGIGRLRGEDRDTLRAKELDRRRLGAVQVAGADETGATGAQRHQQRHGFRLKMDAGADRQAFEGPCGLELGSRRLQQPAAVGDPVDTGGGVFQHVRPSPFPFLLKARKVPEHGYNYDARAENLPFQFSPSDSSSQSRSAANGAVFASAARQQKLYPAWRRMKP